MMIYFFIDFKPFLSCGKKRELVEIETKPMNTTKRFEIWWGIE